MILPLNILSESGIYAIFCKENGLLYIGKSKHIKVRFFEHLNSLKGNYHKNKRLQNCWNKHGKDSFDFFIIEYCEDMFCDVKEEFWIYLYKSHMKNYGFNVLFKNNDFIEQNKRTRKPKTEEERKKSNEIARQRAISNNYHLNLQTKESRLKASLAKRNKSYPKNAISQSLKSGIGRIWWLNLVTGERFYGTTSELRIKNINLLQTRLSKVAKQEVVSYKNWTNEQTLYIMATFLTYFDIKIKDSKTIFIKK